MILKSSFLIDMLENMKRRSWVFCISFFLFFCSFPGYLILYLNNIRNIYGNKGMHSSGIEKEMMVEVKNLFSVNFLLPIFIIGLAVLIGIQGFSYLHDKRQVDFYHSQPVKRSRRFLVLWSNGSMIFIVTYLINMILGILVASGYGVMDSSIIRAGLRAFFLYYLLFLGIYHLAILAVLITGNTLVSLMIAGILMGYEILLRFMITVMAAGFFVTYGSGMEERMFHTLISPIVDFYKYVVLVDRNKYYGGTILPDYGSTAIKLFRLAALLGILIFFCYQKRASEGHGKSISFSKIKEGLRFLLLFLFGIMGSYGIYVLSGNSVMIGIAGGGFFVGLGHAILQMIYEVDFRAIKKKWTTAVLTFVIVSTLFLCFKYDFTGYDRRIPNQENVESIHLSLPAEGFSSGVYVLHDGTEIYGSNFAKKEMQLKDFSIIYQLLEKREDITKERLDSMNHPYDSIEFTFRLKNGKTEYRRLYFLEGENLELLNEIYHMEEYQLANQQPLEENFVTDYQVISAQYYNGLLEEEVKGVAVESLVEAYKKDLEAALYSEVYYEVPIGKLRLLGIGLINKEYRNSWELLIYDSYENTIQLLKEAGLICRNVYLNELSGQVEGITVTYTDEEKKKQNEALSYEECEKTIVYQSEEFYERILPKVVPQENKWWMNRSKSFNNDYYISLEMKNSMTKGDSYTEVVYFKEGEIPEFILKDLEETDYGEKRIIKN